jgi:hypothetical protein
MPDTKTDWFVAAGAKSGDGSLDKPFHDPWLAFYCAAAGDVIHIAAGTYFGRYDRSSWVIDRPNLTVRGGYSRDFSSRAPWQRPTVFAVFSGYEYSRENNLLSGRDDHSGLLLDGLFFDASDRNSYGDKPVEGIRSYPTMDGPITSCNAKDVTISMKSQIKEIESHKPVAVAEPVYCPAFDWQKAIALALDESIGGAGAHTRKLTVSFAAAQSKPDIAYAAITAQAIDADHASLDNQPVELEVTEARLSYANPSWFPSGMTSEDYAAYTIATAGDPTRTRVAIVVRLDTAASKLLDRTVPTDKLRVRGIARVPGNPGVLSIVVDSAEAVES